MQLSMPNVPTDNLYKFIAIFGLILSASLFLYADYMKSQVQIEIVQHAKVQNERLYELIEGFAKNKPNLEMELLKRKYLDLLEIESAKLIVSSVNYEFYQNARNYGSPFFLIISIVGFILWFYKVQRYQDKILQKEASHNKSRHTNMRHACGSHIGAFNR